MSDRKTVSICVVAKMQLYLFKKLFIELDVIDKEWGDVYFNYNYL